MKRPLFFVALAYALGEVIGIYTKTVEQIGIVFAVLVFAIVYFMMYKKKKSMWMIPIGIALGVVHAFFRIPAMLKNPAEITAYEETDYQIVTYQKEEISRETCNAAGIIVGEDGNAYILQVLESDYKQIEKRRILIRGMENPDVSISDIVQVTGDYLMFQKESNPGAFPSAVYYYARGVTGYFYQPEIHRIGDSVEKGRFVQCMHELYRWKRALCSLRSRLDRRLSCLLPEESAALFSGILLGDKTEITQETKRLYQVGGIAHVLAISGLHISLVGTLIFKLLRRMRLPYLPSGLLAIFFVWGYGIFTGMSLATIRAVWMFAISIVAQILGRNYDMPTSMGLALLCMLLVNPARILDTGVQLSYMAIAGVAFGRYILRQLHRNQRFQKFEKKHRIRFRVVQSLLYSVTLNSMMLPVLAKCYYTISTYAWIVNLLAIPLMTVVVVSGWAGIACSVFSIKLGTLAIFPGNLVLRGYDLLCKATLKLPGNTICTGTVNLLQMLAWYGGIFLLMCVLHKNMRKRARETIYKYTGRYFGHRQIVWYCIWSAAFCCSMECLAQCTLWKMQRKEAVCFLDVGQGDGILIRSEKGTHIVIDGGSTSQSAAGTYTILPALKAQGMCRVDYWFITHTDADHINGLKEILEMGDLAQIQIKTIVFSAYIEEDEAWNELAEAINHAGIPISWMQEADAVYDESFLLTCLHPGASYHPADKNAASLAFAYESECMCLLFTGDMDADAVKDMMETPAYAECGNKFPNKDIATPGEPKRRFDCIKLPHHGSKYSYSTALYADTEYGVVSCGKNNRYGHPHTEVVEGLEAEHVRILRTDEDGAVFFRMR